jgi:hypothetical protein
MADTATSYPLTVEDLRPNVTHLVTEDDTPVGDWFSEKQQRMLTEPLYASWHPVLTGAKAEEASDTASASLPREFLAAANVGLYYGVHQDPVVPDVMLSLDVSAPADWWEKHNRVYMVWEFGKTPEFVIEIVSNLVGNELGKKIGRYAKMGILYYAIYDPSGQYGSQLLRLYALQGSEYVEVDGVDPEKFPLTLTVWQGVYESCDAEWLRWQTHEEELIPTGRERAESERERAESERERAESERERAESERERAEVQHQRAERERERAAIERERADEAERRAGTAEERAAKLTEKLRALGVNTDDIL